MGTGADEYPIRRFDDPAAWAEWLEEHHSAAAGVWLRLSRKDSGERSISHGEALLVALCYGWIDGQARKFDADSWLQKFTPRGKRSVWSKRNRDLAERLIADGEMRSAGQAAIDAAKRDGRWERAYDSPASASNPPDLEAALDKDPAARAFFESLSRSKRFVFLHRIQTAVRPETRARRISKFVEMLARRETL